MLNVPRNMIFKSIKWRLQLWYGLILVVVLAGFGFTAYQLERGKMYRQIDTELMRRVGALANVLRPPPPHRPVFSGQSFASPPPDQLSDNAPPGQNPRRPVEFHLPPELASLFDPADPNNFYYIINSRDGSELARSTNAPKVSVVWDNRFPVRTDTLPQMPADFLHAFLHATSVQTFGKFRDMSQTLPPGEMIRVGCSIAPGLKELRLAALRLTAVGAGILLLGLAGGGWLVGRAIKPIEEISATAVKISAGDLSQRINVAETESELGQLTSVLNSTFARLEAAFAQQQQFTADAAHELRTPVSVMLTQTQTALNRERSGAEYRETVEACQRASQRMRKLIESLLELARLDAGQEPMKRLKFDLSQTAWDCVELVRPLAAERGVKIHCDLPTVEAHGDAERLAQVITNLLANAVQYNKVNGEVRISVKLQGSMILLAVSDTGPGISSEDLPHVFKRFYRADQSRSSGQTGLGLAISKAIVEAHGGTIEVLSRPGAETTFTVVLPI
jgi:two-component system, OmpR family, sensor kinase